MVNIDHVTCSQSCGQPLVISSRLDGLCVLQRLLVECDTDVFEQHCISWAGLLLTALQVSPPHPPKPPQIGVGIDLIKLIKSPIKSLI